jgi:hypothetical protein
MNLRSSARLLLLLALTALPVAAQTPTHPGVDRGWTRVRAAKWALLGLAVGMGGYAIVQTSRAQDRYEALGRVCVNEPERCRLEDGRYTDPALEQLYDESARHDLRAQTGIAGAHVALFGSAALFIYDLRNARGPRNIPYPSHSSAAPPGGIVVGARVSF